MSAGEADVDDDVFAEGAHRFGVKVVVKPVAEVVGAGVLVKLAAGLVVDVNVFVFAYVDVGVVVGSVVLLGDESAVEPCGVGVGVGGRPRVGLRLAAARGRGRRPGGLRDLRCGEFEASGDVVGVDLVDGRFSEW